MPHRAHELQEQVASSLQLLQARGELAALEARWFGAQNSEEQVK
jgi:hypothetical protein